MSDRYDQEAKAKKVPAWVLRMEAATDSGGHADVQTGYRCSGFEANAVAKEWRDNQARIAELEAGYCTQLTRDQLHDEICSAIGADVDLPLTEHSVEECVWNVLVDHESKAEPPEGER